MNIIYARHFRIYILSNLNWSHAKAVDLYARSVFLLAALNITITQCK